VTGGVGDLEPGHCLAAAQHAKVRFGDRANLAPQAIHVVAVEPRRTREQLRRVDEMRRAALVHPDLHVGPALDERPDGAGVVEVDVGQRDRARPLVAERFEQRVHARCRPAVDQHIADLEHAHHALMPELADVNRSYLRAAHPQDKPYIPPLRGRPTRA
jgi:hypothetical protein